MPTGGFTPSTSYRLWASYGVYDASTGQSILSSEARSTRTTRLQDAFHMRDRLCRDIAYEIARDICRGRYPDVMVGPSIGAVSPLGSNDESFNMTDAASSGWCTGAELVCLPTRVVGFSLRYDFQKIDMDKLELVAGEAYYCSNDYHIGLLLGRRSGLGGFGYVYPHGSIGLNVSLYEEVFSLDGRVASEPLEPTGMVTIGGGLTVRPGAWPVAFSFSAECAFGRSAYTQRTWHEIRRLILEEYPTAQLPDSSPDYNVAHLRIAVALGYAL